MPLVITATHPEELPRHADRVLQVRNGTVNEWERQTAHALLEWSL
jgi:ABC-type lipoprotein export system ATPase subunit